MDVKSIGGIIVCGAICVVPFIIGIMTGAY